MLSLTQKLSQQQKLSPQQIQYQKLLQLNTLALEQRIKTELELNPFLEVEFDVTEELSVEEDARETETTSSEETSTDDNSDEVEVNDKDYVDDSADEYMSEYLKDDEYYDDVSYNNFNRDEDDKFQPTAPARESLSEKLLQQLYLQDVSDKLKELGEEIIGNLDEDGYLKTDLEKIVDEMNDFHHTEITHTEAEKLLQIIQTFDPIGIASRTLQECLLVQIKNKKFDKYFAYLAEQLLVNHFDDFVHKRYDALKQKMEMSQETLKSVIDLIQHLNPKPGEGNIEVAEQNQITPDFFVEFEDDNLVVVLNERSQPSITINQQYSDMLRETKTKKGKNDREKNAYKFLKEKFESAKWFRDCIRQRNQTLLGVMAAIAHKQKSFFVSGPKFLKPMIYRQIAEDVSLDISTISRVVNGKFVQSGMGIHELKYFFSEGLQTDSGEEVSNKHIKERLKEIIDGEDKVSPLSDDALADMLNQEGIQIARRTVAKYREQLRLPVARLRKEL